MTASTMTLSPTTGKNSPHVVRLGAVAEYPSLVDASSAHGISDNTPSVHRHGPLHARVIAVSVGQPRRESLEVFGHGLVVPVRGHAVRPIGQQIADRGEQLRALVNGDARGASTRVAFLVRVVRVVFELEVEAHVMHPLEHFVVRGGVSDRAITTPTNERFHRQIIAGDAASAPAISRVVADDA